MKRYIVQERWFWERIGFFILCLTMLAAPLLFIFDFFSKDDEEDIGW